MYHVAILVHPVCHLHASNFVFLLIFPQLMASKSLYCTLAGLTWCSDVKKKEKDFLTGSHLFSQSASSSFSNNIYKNYFFFSGFQGWGQTPDKVIIIVIKKKRKVMNCVCHSCSVMPELCHKHTFSSFTWSFQAYLFKTAGRCLVYHWFVLLFLHWFRLKAWTFLGYSMFKKKTLTTVQ